MLLGGMNQAGMSQSRAGHQGRADHMPRHSSGHCLGAEATALGSACRETTFPTMSRRVKLGRTRANTQCAAPKSGVSLLLTRTTRLLEVQVEKMSLTFLGSSSVQEQPQSSGSREQMRPFGHDNVSTDYSKLRSVNTLWVGF